MGKTFVISGGNSGIGLEAGRQLARQGHHVVLLGRSPSKGDAAVADIKNTGGSAEFVAADLSTHAGVHSAAQAVASKHPKIDGLVLGAGVLTFADIRTGDDLHAVFAVNYLSRYHLAQRLLPQLKAAGSSTIVILVAQASLKTKIDFSVFPKFKPFPGPKCLPSIQICNHHYVAHLAKVEPGVRAAVMNVGLVKTDIMRDMSAFLRVLFNVLGPLITIPVAKSAANAVWLSTSSGWSTGSYWPKPGRPELSTPLALDADVTAKVAAISRELTGA